MDPCGSVPVWIDRLCSRSLVIYDNMGRLAVFVAITAGFVVTAFAL